MTAARIIEAALSARTLREAEALEQAIAADLGATFYRPVGDKVNNFGLMTTSGSYDFKLIENVTNMQDALLERAAGERFSDLDDVPFATPHEAARVLLGGRGDAELARGASVEFFNADLPPRSGKRITPVFRDAGCGIEAGYVADSIFALGSAHKSKAVWQQGAFGIGGATTFRNADAVVLVTRRAPEMAPEEDRIVVAVCLWQRSVKGKGLFYLVTDDWSEGRNRDAAPWSAPATTLPDFEPGTHLALINYGTERLHAIRHSDNPNSFDRILDTRLFRPVSPVRFENHLIPGDHARVRRGLGRRFEDNPRLDRTERTAAVPFRVGDQTYQLPITFFFFDAAARAKDSTETVGDKKNFVAHGHSLMFTSNGQTHHHWTPLEFRDRTKLNKVSDHVLVVVETDPLPIAVRTDFFTADRSGVRASEETLRLESTVADFLNGWDELRDINSKLIMESIRSSRNDRPTLEISRQIRRAYAVRTNGFALNTNGNGNNGRPSRSREPKPPAALYPDPTILRGPECVKVLPGTSRSIRYSIDARGEFFTSRRGELTVECSHPDISPEDIAIGPAHDGRVRVILTLPMEAQLGDWTLVASIKGWQRAAGGLGGDLRFETRLVVADTVEPVQPPVGKRGSSKPRTNEGPQVALLWRSGEAVGLTPIMPGRVEEVEARLIAAEPEYAELAALKDAPVLTIYLNEDYAPLKRYISIRQRELVAGTPAQDRYAVDVGVAMLVLHQERESRVKKGQAVDEALLETARQAAAQGALSILPQFDELAKQVGLSE